MSSPNQPTSYNTAPPTPPTAKERLKNVLNFPYLRSLNFVLKIAIIVAHIGGSISVSIKYTNWTETLYYNFAAISGIAIILIVILLHFFKVMIKLTRVPWRLVEFIIDIIWAILILIASAICTDKARTLLFMESYAAAAFFGYAATLLYLIDAFLRLVEFIRGRKTPRPNTNQSN